MPNKSRNIKITPHMVNRILIWGDIIKTTNHLWTPPDEELISDLLKAQKKFYHERNQTYHKKKEVII